MSFLVEVSCRVYRALLRAQPESLRARYGSEMEEVFREQMMAARERGMVAVAEVWWATVGETMESAGPVLAPKVLARGGVLVGSVAGSVVMAGLALVSFATMGPLMVAHGSDNAVTLITIAPVPDRALLPQDVFAIVRRPVQGWPEAAGKPR